MDEAVEMQAGRTAVSVGMPVYNGGRWLRAAIDAILAQTLEDFELLISDNASDDDSEEICRELATQDKRIRYHRNAENVGASDNYNKVFAMASGKYFKWASCNDHCDPGFLEKCVNVLESCPDVVLACPKTRLFEDLPQDGTPYNDNLHLASDDAYTRFTTFLQNVRLNNVMNGVIRTEILKRTGLIKPYFASDTCLMATLSLYGKFYEIPEFLFYRRMDAASATRHKSAAEVTRHWSPDMKPVLFSDTRGMLDYYAAVCRAPLAWRTRGRLLVYLSRSAVWNRHKIWRELVAGGRYFLGMSRPG